ncbi:MerR family transcriptional regulator [Gordonia sihwensis]|uniref:MerR family transcriptional regulator n=1 Tax=Gordonia sihwensis TaxID=173559 RepID=UPI003D955FB8
MSDQLALFDIRDTPAETDGYRIQAVQAIAGITYRQLDYWTRTSLVTPSVRNASGSGSQRLYSFTDIVLIKVIKRLLDTGISLQNIRKAIDFLRENNSSIELSEVTLISDGASIYECTDNDAVIDLLSGGQCVFCLDVGRTVSETRVMTRSFPSEPAVADDGPDAVVGDELAARRKMKNAS